MSHHDHCGCRGDCHDHHYDHEQDHEHNHHRPHRRRLSGEPLLRLSLVPPGQRAQVVDVAAGQCVARRLSSLGLAAGIHLTVIQQQGNGPFLVAVNDTRLVVERGLAHKVFVRLLPEEAPEKSESPKSSPLLTTEQEAQA